MAAAAAVVPPALGAGTMQREQLLPAAAGQGVAMKVDGHRATVTLSKNGLRWALGVDGAHLLLLPRNRFQPLPLVVAHPSRSMSALLLLRTFQTKQVALC